MRYLVTMMWSTLLLLLLVLLVLLNDLIYCLFADETFPRLLLSDSNNNDYNNGDNNSIQKIEKLELRIKELEGYLKEYQLQCPNVVIPSITLKTSSSSSKTPATSTAPQLSLNEVALSSNSKATSRSANSTNIEAMVTYIMHNQKQKQELRIKNELVTNPSSPSSLASLKNEKFYLYELEEEYWWRWPRPGTDCSKNGYVGHEHATLSGMGTSLKPEDGLYLTWHFSLFSSLFNRLKRSSRRTRDPKEASLFIVAYDLGLDGYLNAETCSNSRRCTNGLPQRLSEYLSNSPYFQRHQGADHAVLWSLGQYHPWPHNGCDIFMRDFCKKCTFTCYWMDSTKPESRFISVPFPSAYHWSDVIQNVPWDLKLIPQRKMLAVYLGSTQTLNPAHTKIRRAMTAQCNASSACHWLQIAHSSVDQSIGDFLSIYKRAVFCLCPPGDDPARKAVFDAIVSGCIPVIFQKETLYNQYPWHIGESDALDISVSIPGALVRAGKLDFMSVLLNIPASTIRRKQQALARVAPRVQYAIPPEHLLVNRSDDTPWEPAFPDGVDATLDGMFDRVRKVLRNESTLIPPPMMLQKAWHQQYDVVIVKVPNDELTDADFNAIESNPADSTANQNSKSSSTGQLSAKTSNLPPTEGVSTNTVQDIVVHTSTATTDSNPRAPQSASTGGMNNGGHGRGKHPPRHKGEHRMGNGHHHMPNNS